MFFGIFVLNRVLILSIFVLNRVSFVRQQPITLFLNDKQPALMFYECLKMGIKNRNSVLNRVGKSAVFVLNRVRVWGAKPHLPTQGYIEYPLRDIFLHDWYKHNMQQHSKSQKHFILFVFENCKIMITVVICVSTKRIFNIFGLSIQFTGFWHNNAKNHHMAPLIQYT